MLAELLRSKLRAKLLGWLFTHTDQRYFVRQLESILKEEAGNLSRELARLAAIGVVKVEMEGHQKYYQANADCPVFSENVYENLYNRNGQGLSRRTIR